MSDMPDQTTQDPAAGDPQAQTPDTTPRADPILPLMSDMPAIESPLPVASGWVTASDPAVTIALPGSFVIAGLGARVVAYYLDALLLSIIPTLLTLLVVDFRSLFEAAMEASRTGVYAQAAMPVTLPIIMVGLIGLGLQFIYFVGFWTSGGRATPGMRVMRLQVIDAASSGALRLMPAIKRWALLGGPLTLLILLEPLQGLASPLASLVVFVMLLTTIASDRRQGLHDRAAGSLVIRDASSGNAATAIGCLLIIGVVTVITILAVIILVAVVGPQLQPMIPTRAVI